MNKIFSKPALLTLSFSFILCLLFNQATAQGAAPTAHIYPCGTDANYILSQAQSVGGGGGYPVYAPITPFDPAAIMSCGKFDAYFQDVNRHFQAGFDDTTHVGGTTVGAQRRAVFCQVLTYIQTVYDFSLVPDSNHIRILVDTSLDRIYPGNEGTPFFARASAGYDTTTPGIKKGWVCDFATGTLGAGVDPAPGHYHGTLQMNFDSLYIHQFPTTPMLYWVNYPDSICGDYADMFSVLLHEMGHDMGFISFITFTGEGSASTGLAPYPTQTTQPHIFSALDWSMNVGDNTYPLVLHKLLSGSTSFPTLDSSNPLVHNNFNYWVNDSATPRNLPLFSGIYQGSPGGINSYLSHSDDLLYTYSFRERICDGDQESYLMAPNSVGGTMHRYYTKGELQTFVDILGYHLKSSFAAANPNLYTNHRPFSKKMAQYVITPDNYAYFTEEVTPDYTLTNNTGASITISIPAMVASGEITDADAADLSNIRIDSTTLINYRGCGIGGNNHAALRVSTDGKFITYTPRANFYGKAQFGFNITDGKEDGSYMVMTIEVLKGSNVSCPPGANMVCNANFEEGSEVKVETEDSIPNSTLEGVLHEGKWQGVNFSDSHPYCFHSNLVNTSRASSGIVIENGSGFSCGPTFFGPWGDPIFTSPGDSGSNTTLDNPLPKDDSGFRYQLFMNSGGSYYYLTDSAKHCHRYTLEFDLFGNVHYIYTTLPLQIGFADSLAPIRVADPSVTFNFEKDTIIPFTPHTWIHVTIPISYCGTLSSNILYLGNNEAINFCLDNISFKEDTSPAPPLLVTISQAAAGACRTQLTAHAADTLCSVSYLWSSTAETTLNAQADTVLSNPSAVYTVTVSDGCRDTTKTATITEVFPSPITGPTIVCAGSTISLSDAVAGGTWASGTPSRATVDILSGVVTGVAPGSVRIFYITFCRDTAAYNITVSPPLTISGDAPFCSGAAITLTDAITGGTWSSVNPSIATVGAINGHILGVSGGTTVISYTTGTGCWATSIVTVNTAPPLGPFDIINHVCVGSFTLADYIWGEYSSDPTTGEGTWTISNTAIATLSPPATGVFLVNVVGASAGTTTLSYSVTNACGTTTVTSPITVNPLPGTITGVSTPLCPGATMTAHDATTGGTWGIDDPSIATINSATGNITGVAAGTTTITYTLSSTGCYVVNEITVNPLPVISGSSFGCIGSTIALTALPTGGIWVSGNTVAATVGSVSGIVTGISPGSTTITYTTGTGCATTTVVIIHTPPSAITGASSVCFFSNILLTEAATTGTWSSSNTGIASVAPDGYVYGIGTGTATISYTDGCGISVTKTITVNPLPAIIGGASAVCVGATTLLTDATAGGTWSSSNMAIASINSATGSVTGISAGAIFVSYTLTATGCSTASTLFVRPLPAAITGNVPLCSGSSITLNDGTSGGTWSSSATVVATAGSGTGIVTGVASGTATIAYTLSATGCATSVIVTINPLPSAIAGSSSVCVGSILALSDGVTGGSWSSSATGVATIGTTGMVTGVTTGTSAITYTLATGCLATKIISVNPLPTAIAGFTFLCGAGTTTTLTDLTTGGTWSSSATGVSTIGTTGVVTAVAAGAATITYTMATGCIATTTVSVGVASGDLCAPCSILGNGVYTPAGIGGSITTDLPAGKYYIANDVTITNNVTMTDAVIFMAPNVHLYVAPKWSLTTKGSHLFSCSGNMWAGISLLSDGVQTGVLTLEGDAGLTSTLIEDAVVGVDIESPILPNSGAPLFLESANAVFNRDDTGIKIVDYSPPSASAYPFLIEYTAFTTRKLWSGSPSSWARYFDLVNLIPVGDYEAPFSVINYSYKACYNDDPILQTVGVYLNGIGTGTYPDYAGIVVGDSIHSAANLFDTLNFGIRAVDASVTVHNDIFTHMASQDYRDGSWQQDHGGAGVYASTTDGENYSLSVEAALNRTGAVVYKLPNYFYNCRMGVAGLNYFSMRGTESYMITTQRADGPRRNYGYNMQSGFYDLADLDSNTIINVANGIVFKAAAPWLTTAVMGNPGEIDINSNTIQATIPFGTLTNQYVDKPVWVENSIAWAYIIGVGLPPTAYTALHSDGNTISDAYNGIYVSGIGPQKVTSDGNTISMIEYPGASTQQYGVYHAACMNDDIGRNVITGTNYKNDNWNGVLVWSSSTHNVTCNEVNTVGRGCEIDGTTLTSAFGANTMTNNGKGFVLGGVIGQQGNNLFPSFNRWEQTGGFTWGGFPQTITQFSADPNASPLWVYPGVATDPSYNLNDVLNCGFTYGCVSGTTSGSGNGLVVGSYPISYEAMNCDIAHNGNKPPDQQMTQMVRQLIPTPRPALDYWMSQHALWELMVHNDTLGDTSAALNAFRAMAVHSRFWLLHEIEHKIGTGQVAEAQALLDNYGIDTLNNTQTDTTTGVQMADNTDADVIVNNYRQFYQLYINYLENTLINSDSVQVEAIANLCPITNGEVVFKARALYDLIHDTLRLFPSNCSDSVGRIDSTAQRQSHITGIVTTGDNIGQEYTLYPNPNDGNFELLQKVTDDAPVKVEIWDAIGQSIYKYEAQFTNAMSKLHVRNVASGLYLLQVTDSKGRIFRFKFVVE